MPATVLILNGPNLNLLGDREPQIYGHETLADIEAAAKRHGETLGFNVDFRQSNHEGQLIDWIHEVRGRAAGLIVNAGGLTHTSVALLDALTAADMPVIEVHLSNIHRRDAFRRHSYVAQASNGSICGFGSHGYLLALDAMTRLITQDG